MYLDFIFFAVVLAIGLLLFCGKGEATVMWFVAKPKHKKEDIDSVKLCRFIGKLFMGGSGCVLLWIIGEITDIFVFTLVGLILLVLIALFGYFYTHIGNKFIKK